MFAGPRMGSTPNVHCPLRGGAHAAVAVHAKRWRPTTPHDLMPAHSQFKKGGQDFEQVLWTASAGGSAQRWRH